RSHEIEVFSAHLVEDFGAATPEWRPDSIARRDFEWMTSCDVFVALLPGDRHGNLARTDGTHVELGWASALGKPIILVMDAGVEEQQSQLLGGLGAVAPVHRAHLRDMAYEPSRLVCLMRDILFADRIDGDGDVADQLAPEAAH